MSNRTRRWRMLVAACGQESAGHFAAAHPGVKDDVQAGGSSRGIADVRQGLAG